MKDGVGETIRPAAAASSACVVCKGGPLALFACLQAHEYLRCPNCAATVLDARHRLSRDDEYAHYLHHENDPGDLRYRAFLSRVAVPLMARFPAPARGLDYGCGQASQAIEDSRHDCHTRIACTPAASHRSACQEKG